MISGIRERPTLSSGGAGTGGRIQCDIGTFDHCLTINADGSIGSAFGGSTEGYASIPALLYAYKSTGEDLATFISPVPAPATWLTLIGGVLAVAAARRRRAA